ncbi:arm repeat superfamily protein [Trifolium pratense]|uniref:Arm repeat superfamily protein n=1 Tax=Trifolium pratense TaxID=57577 RepID=A0A2K3LHT0_TRIPR|nr:arm repeat superfamily protein [Trifolium pratense]
MVRTRILPLYTIVVSVPYLISSANWVLGELGSCLPEEMSAYVYSQLLMAEMSADVYSQLLMALVMPDKQDTSCYPVRNDYMSPDFLPLLQVIVSNIGNDENDSPILFQLLSSIMETGEEKVSVLIPHTIPSIMGSVSKWLTSNLEP